MVLQLLAVPAFAADCGGEATYKAVPGGSASDIHFHNGASDQRRIYWLDENGQRKLKAVVDGGQTQRVSTVAGHAWVVTDAAEKCLYVILAASAPITAEVGGAKGPPQTSARTSPAAGQPVTTAAGLGLSGWYQISAVSKPGQALNNMENGRPEIERVKPDWDSALWQISDIGGSGFVVVTNKWTQKNLAVAGEGLHTIVGAVTGQGAQWSLESAGTSNHVLIKSRFNGRYLSVAAKGFQFVETAGVGNAAVWQLARPVKSNVAEEKREQPEKSRKCPSGERFDRDRLDCVSIKCGRHQVFSKSKGRCLNKADTCDSDEVYSSSLAACIPKQQPKAPTKPKPKQPKAPPCAYKVDGVGNCLTPQFLACQKAFGACMKACSGKAGGKCEAACSTKYAGTCGD